MGQDKIKYVSRGGLKLESALEHFSIDARGKVCMDVGSSTGGFTDCLLQRGAKSVYAVDVGKGLLDWKLRNDPRIKIFENTNFKYFLPELLAEKPELVAIDVSFISLTKILHKTGDVIAAGGIVLGLIKPQFEADRKDLRKGIVMDEEVQLQSVERIKAFAPSAGFEAMGTVVSAVKGTKGNTEYFIYLKPKKR